MVIRTHVPDGRHITSQIQKAAGRAEDARVARDDGLALADRICAGKGRQWKRGSVEGEETQTTRVVDEKSVKSVRSRRKGTEDEYEDHKL